MLLKTFNLSTNHIYLLVLGHELNAQILFLHAFTGCDSTSRIYGIGKKSVFSKIVENKMSLLSHTKAFMTPNLSRSTIEEIGEKSMSLLFGDSSTDSFSNLR